MKHVGVWIDRERAIVVEFTNEGPHAVEIESGAPGKVKIGGGMVGRRGQISGASHQKAENKRLASLDRFYGEVAEALEGAHHIALIGPGQAKKHLAKKLREQHDPGEIVAVLAVDKLTDPQIVARLRDILDVPGRRG